MNQYLKATAYASIIYLVAPITFLYIGYAEMQSPNWDANDSGAVQGFAFGFLSALSGLICVGVAFPLIAKELQPNFTARKWVYLNIFTVWLISFLASCVFCYYTGASSAAYIINDAFGLSLLLIIIGLVFLSPAMFIWLRVAKITHNKLSQKGAQKARASA